jgi:hypothetical protein
VDMSFIELRHLLTGLWAAILIYQLFDIYWSRQKTVSAIREATESWNRAKELIDELNAEVARVRQCGTPGEAQLPIPQFPMHLKLLVEYNPEEADMPVVMRGDQNEPHSWLDRLRMVSFVRTFCGAYIQEMLSQIKAEGYEPPPVESWYAQSVIMDDKKWHDSKTPPVRRKLKAGSLVNIKPSDN